MSDDKNYQVGRIECGAYWTGDIPPFFSGMIANDKARIRELEVALRGILKRSPLVEREDLGLLICDYCGMACANYGDDITHADDCAYVKAQAALGEDKDNDTD